MLTAVVVAADRALILEPVLHVGRVMACASSDYGHEAIVPQLKGCLVTEPGDTVEVGSSLGAPEMGSLFLFRSRLGL